MRMYLPKPAKNFSKKKNLLPKMNKMKTWQKSNKRR
jgi:hypothetical protein